MKEKNGELVSIQSNPFLNGRKDYSSIEKKILHIAISQINPQLPNSKIYDKDLPIINISTTDIISMLGNKGYYTTLHSICLKMAKKVIEMPCENEGWRIMPVFSSLDFTKKSGLYVEFNPKMKPYILQLADKNFTKISLAKVLSLESVHAISIFELVIQHRNIPGNPKVRTISIDDLKKYMNVANNKSYNRIDNFRSKVLDKPLEELNEKLAPEAHISYEPIKSGRKITAFRFYLYINESEKNITEAQSLPLDVPADISQIMSIYGISEAVTAQYIENYGIERVKANIEYLKANKKQITSGLIIDSIKNNYADKEAQLDEIKQKEKAYEADKKAQKLGYNSAAEQKEAQEKAIEAENRKVEQEKEQERLEEFKKIEEAIANKDYKLAVSDFAINSIKKHPAGPTAQSYANKFGISADELYQWITEKTFPQSIVERQRKVANDTKILAQKDITDDLLSSPPKEPREDVEIASFARLSNEKKADKILPDINVSDNEDVFFKAELIALILDDTQPITPMIIASAMNHDINVKNLCDEYGVDFKKRLKLK